MRRVIAINSLHERKGIELHPQSVRRLSRKGLFPPIVHIGSRAYFDEEEVDQWLEAQKAARNEHLPAGDQTAKAREIAAKVRREHKAKKAVTERLLAEGKIFSSDNPNATSVTFAHEVRKELSKMEAE
jgi:predicted DNA-binding transcriptional regulator AlpA